jgi:flavodoxin
VHYITIVAGICHVVRQYQIGRGNVYVVTLGIRATLFKWRKSTMNVLVLYHSRDGHTHEAAEAIAQSARDLNCNVVIKPLIEVSDADVQQANLLFIGTWVHGLILFNVRPAEAELWVPSLPSLNGKSVAVFCTYAFNPRSSLQTLGSMLTEHGATIVAEKAFHRSDPKDGAGMLVNNALRSVKVSVV